MKLFDTQFDNLTLIHDLVNSLLTEVYQDIKYNGLLPKNQEG